MFDCIRQQYGHGDQPRPRRGVPKPSHHPHLIAECPCRLCQGSLVFRRGRLRFGSPEGRVLLRVTVCLCSASNANHLTPRQNSPVHSSGYCMQLPTISRGAHWLRLQLAALCLTSSITVAMGYQLPPPPNYVRPPAKQTLAVQLKSNLNGADWIDYKRMMPADRQWVFDPPLVERLRTASGECVIVMLHFFDDGSMRPTGQLLDETCLFALSDWKELRTNGSVAEFNAHTPNGTVEVWLSARWVNPPSQGLTDLMRAELAELPQLSPDQAQQQARQREILVRAMKADAVDRAWRAARRAP